MTEVTAGSTAIADARPTVLYGCLVTYPQGDQVLHVLPGDYLDVIARLKADGYNLCLDVTAVDYLAAPGVRQLPDSVAPQRFEVVVILMSHALRRRVRLRVQVAGDPPTLPTLFDLYPGTEAMEREVYDLMGVVFEDHPDLTRILMPEDWEGHPLRKDYSQGRIPVQFKFPEGKYTAEDRP